jgi:tRNA threonylcarbamoyladenosine biosynthesis protein TsaB
MKVLGIDTSGEACTAALWDDGDIIERFERVRQQHAERILPMVETVLAEAGVTLGRCDAVAMGRGPGAFTSLRIGSGVALGLAFAADLPVLPVSSLAVLAQGQTRPSVLAAFDARMDQVYWGAYVRNNQGLVELLGAEGVTEPSRIRVPGAGPWLGAGSGWDRYADQLQVVLNGAVAEWRPEQYPHAGDLVRLAADAFHRGLALPATVAAPEYLRDDVAKKPAAAGV